MTSKHAELLLEKYLMDDIKEYVIDEDYIDFYKKDLILSKENEKLIREMLGAKIHDIISVESNDYMPIVSIRAHITFNDKLYSFLATSDVDVEAVILYETDKIFKDICNIYLPEREKEMLKTLSL